MFKNILFVHYCMLCAALKLVIIRSYRMLSAERVTFFESFLMEAVNVESSIILKNLLHSLFSSCAYPEICKSEIIPDIQCD